MCRPLPTHATRTTTTTLRCALCIYVQHHHRRHQEDLPFEERERRRQFGGARRPAPPPTQPLPPPPTPKPAADKQPPPVHPKRANKNRPIEQSSKKAVPRFRDVLQAGNKAPADPRFARDAEEPGQHSSSKELWRKRYAFVFDELLPQEKQEAQRAMAVRMATHEEAACMLKACTEDKEQAHQGGAAAGAKSGAGAAAGRARSEKEGPTGGQAAGALWCGAVQ